MLPGQRSILHYLVRKAYEATRSWARLPHDTAREVLSWLGLADACCCAALVCASWWRELKPRLPALARAAAFGSDARLEHLLSIQAHRGVQPCMLVAATAPWPAPNLGSFDVDASEGGHVPAAAAAVVQPHITPRMRAVLVDWLVDVALYFSLEDDVLHAAVGVMDRFLSAPARRGPMPKARFQLLGITALFLATKLGSSARSGTAALPVGAPHPRTLSVRAAADVTDNTFSAAQVREMEREIVEALRFRMWNSTTLHFLYPLLDACEHDGHADEELLHVARFVADLALMREPYAREARVLLAACAALVARCVLGHKPHWPPALRHATGLCPHAMPLMRRICNDLFVAALCAEDEQHGAHSGAAAANGDNTEPLCAIAAKFPAVSEVCAGCLARSAAPPFPWIEHVAPHPWA